MYVWKDSMAARLTLSVTLYVTLMATLAHGRRRRDMADFWFVLITLAFFAVSIAYTHGCDRL